MLDTTGAQLARFLIRVVSIDALRWALAVAVVISLVSAVPDAGAVDSIVINEIHFNPGKLTGESEREKQEEEFVELYNPGRNPVSLDGWQFSRGIDYQFGAINVAPGDFLVIAADLEAFRIKHPEVKNVVGPYAGQLSNAGEDIELEDASGERIDLVDYADSGHWAKRRSTKLKSFDHWEWIAPHDGEGASLELIDPSLDSAFAHAWAPSQTVGGSPGRRNSVASSEQVPLIGTVEHIPAIPSSQDSIAVVAQMSGSVKQARLLFRRDGGSRFRSSELTRSSDDGVTWRGEIPSHGDGAVVEYLVEATAQDGSIRRWPELQRAAGKDPVTDSISLRQALCMFQVDDGFTSAPIVSGERNPFYKIIMPRREIALMRSIAGRSSNNAVYNNRYHGTFISVDPGGTRVRHLCSMRMRGNGSRSAFPPGIRVTFPSDDRWKGVQNINLNSQYTHSQVLGSAIHQVLGFPAARATAVTLSMNGEDWTRAGLPQFGHYTCNEVLDSDYIDAHFPTEAVGNLYRGVGQANLNDRGDKVSAYRTYYRKRNNGSKDDFSDVIQLCRVLDRNGDKTVSDAQFLAQVRQVVDVDQWLRYFALDTLLCNLEGGFPTGRGDDYAMFRGGDGRFRLVPYDLDSILGRGDPGENLTKSIFAYGNTIGLRRLFKHPEVVRIYFRHIRDFLATSYRPEVLNRIVDDVLGSWVPESEIDDIKAFIPRRIAAVRSQIEGYTVAGSTLEFVGGFHRTERADFLLYGRFDPAEVVEVRVNGREPTSSDLRSGTWVMRSTVSDPLVSPGITPVVIEMKGANGKIVDQSTLQVWYDTGKMTDVSGWLAAGDTRWDAESGPYLVTGGLTVPSGSTLHVAPGTTVFFAGGAGLRVAGKLVVAGAASHPVRFAAPVTGEMQSGSLPSWEGITFTEGSTGEIAYAAFDGANNAKGALSAVSGSLVLEHVDFGGGKRPTVAVVDTALTVRGCTFASASGFIVASGGSVVVEDSEFGGVQGDLAVELTGKLDKVASIQRNTFVAGGSNAAIHIGYDAVVLKNLFGVGDSIAESAILAADAARIVVAGNGFLGWKTALSAAAGAQVAFVKNTCRFSNRDVLIGDLANVDQMDNVVVPNGTPGTFVQSDSAWLTNGRTVDWTFLDVETTGDRATTDLLSVAGVPPGGKCADGERAITFTYPGAASFRIIGDEASSRMADHFSATFISDGKEPIGVEITLLTGETIRIPDAAQWQPITGHVDVMISEITAVDSDAVELYNYGLGAVDLSGFRLTDDREQPEKFVFPRGTVIPADGHLVVEFGKDDPRPDALEAGFGLRDEGEELLLLKPSSASSEAPIDSVRFGSQVAGYSIARMRDGWQLCKPTLGSVNNRAAIVAGPRFVRLEEWLAAGGGGSPDDFIELRNLAPFPADISDCGLTDNIPSAPFRHRFAPLSFLPADGVRAFFAKGKKSKNGELEFKLSDNGEVLGFVAPDGVTVDWAVFRPQAAGRSQGRDDSGNLVTFAVPTPGVVPGSAGMNAAAVLTSALRVSEIHFNPSDDKDSEFIEFANVSPEKLDLAGVRVSGGIDFLFQEGMTLAPGERLVITQSRKAFANSHGESVVPVGEYSGKLSNGGEKIRVTSPAGISIQQIAYSDKWHLATDGGGRSLEAEDLTSEVGDWSRKRAWKASDTDGGTPGR